MTPALLTRISTLPNSSTAFWISPCAWLSSVTSQTAASTRPPLPLIRSTRSASRSSLLAATTTTAPSAASASAVASPMPLEAPVTTATLPSSFAIILAFLVCWSAYLYGGARCSGWWGRQAQVGQRPVGVREGAYGARCHEQEWYQDHARDHTGDDGGRGVARDGQRYRRYKEDEAHDQERQDEGYGDPDGDPELYEQDQQAPPHVAAEDPVAASHGAEDALASHHDLPQGVLAHDGEGYEDDDQREDGQKPHHHRDGDPRSHGLRGGEGTPDRERHRDADHQQKPDRDKEEHDVVAEHAPEVAHPRPECHPETTH